ncbi:unnamed protein product [Amoebophrya sp. A25]|nr:unnamed protein product [Amoebophrya sp. A25]|eukprot:GSA25T00024460001.1
MEIPRGPRDRQTVEVPPFRSKAGPPNERDESAVNYGIETFSDTKEVLGGATLVDYSRLGLPWRNYISSSTFRDPSQRDRNLVTGSEPRHASAKNRDWYAFLALYVGVAHPGTTAWRDFVHYEVFGVNAQRTYKGGNEIFRPPRGLEQGFFPSGGFESRQAAAKWWLPALVAKAKEDGPTSAADFMCWVMRALLADVETTQDVANLLDMRIVYGPCDCGMQSSTLGVGLPAASAEPSKGQSFYHGFLHLSVQRRDRDTSTRLLREHPFLQRTNLSREAESQGRGTT